VALLGPGEGIKKPKHPKQTKIQNISFTSLYGELGCGHVQVDSSDGVLENGRQRRSAQILGFSFVVGTPGHRDTYCRKRTSEMRVGAQILNLEKLIWAEPNSKFQGWEFECPFPAHNFVLENLCPNAPGVPSTNSKPRISAERLWRPFSRTRPKLSTWTYPKWAKTHVEQCPQMHIWVRNSCLHVCFITKSKLSKTKRKRRFRCMSVCVAELFYCSGELKQNTKQQPKHKNVSSQ
jgi:hypothetical protein